MADTDAIEIHHNETMNINNNNNIKLMKSLGSQSDVHHEGTSEQHGLMGPNNIAIEDKNDDEFENQKAKHRKTTISDAIDANDQGNKKKPARVVVVKKKKKKSSKKAKVANNDLF